MNWEFLPNWDSTQIELGLGALTLLVLAWQVVIMYLQVSNQTRMDRLEEWSQKPKLDIVDVRPAGRTPGYYRVSIVNRGGRATAIENVGSFWFADKSTMMHGMGMQKEISVHRQNPAYDHNRGDHDQDAHEYVDASEFSIEPGSRSEVYIHLGKIEVDQVDLHLTLQPVIGDKIQFADRIPTWYLLEKNRAMLEKGRQDYFRGIEELAKKSDLSGYDALLKSQGDPSAATSPEGKPE